MEGLIVVVLVVAGGGACSRSESTGCRIRNWFVVVVVVVGYIKPFYFVRTMDAVCSVCFVVIVIGTGIVVNGWIRSSSSISSYFPRSTWTSNPFLFPVLKLRRIQRKNYLQNSIFTQKPSLPPTTNLDSQQYTYYYKQARHNCITRFDFLLIPLLPQIQPKQHI
jgi:hypothetical protein